jgi:FecR protein
MERMEMRLRMTAALAVAALGLFPPVGSRALAQPLQLGTAQTATGRLTVVRPDGIENQLVGRSPLALFEYDVVGTGANSRAVLDVGDGIQVTLEQSTTFKILYRWERTKGLTPIVRLQKGEISVKASRSGAVLEIETPVAVIAAPRTAELSVRVTGEGNAAVTVVRGAVDVANPLGTCRLQGPRASSLVRGKACHAPVAVETKPPAIEAKPPIVDRESPDDVRPDERDHQQGAEWRDRIDK